MKRSFIVLMATAVVFFALALVASAACDHNWRIDYSKCQAPTCTQSGKNIYVCSRCSQSKTEYVSASGHDYVKASGTYATCEAASTVIEKCSVCSVERKDTTRALGHDYKETRRVNPTCAKAGSITYTCNRCRGTKVDELKTVAHDFSKFISSSATCTSSGQSTYQCSMCSELTLKYTSSLGHDIITTSGPTCTESGIYSYSCSRCKYSRTDSHTTPALGHDVPRDRDDWNIVTKATCHSSGEIRTTCARCNKYVYEDVEKLDHEYSTDLYVVKVPTASAQGKYAKLCIYCDNAVESNIAKGKTDLSGYYVPPVRASAEIGEVARGTAITLSCALKDAQIYYTTDGKSPLLAKYRTKYEEPITITETTYLKAVAVYDSETVIISQGEIMGYTYIVDDSEPWVYFKPDANLGGYMPLAKNEKFRPDAKATRYEVIEALGNLMNSYADDADLTFTDVDGEHAAIVAKFVGANLLSGYEDSTFRGNANIKRGELCKVLALALGLKVKTYVKAKFPDVPTNHWASPYIAALTEKGYLTGDTDGNFRPEDNITRAELAVVLNRIAEVEESDGVSIPDVKSTHWAYSYICSAVEKLK